MNRFPSRCDLVSNNHNPVEDKIMKNVKHLISAIVLSTLTASAFAGPVNGPKPKCPMGQLPVLKNNIWVCEEPSIKAPSRPGLSSSTSRQTMANKAPTRPQRAKPDLSIANILKLNEPTPNVDKFKVYVKNTQGVASAPCKMSLNSTSGGGEIAVPQIPANSGKWLEVSFFEFKDGSRIRLMVDSQKKVTETNENNNKYAFNW
jgi:CARDB